MTKAVPEPSPPRGSYPAGEWRIAWLLAAGVMISYMDRVNISVAQDGLHRSFGISTIQFGFLLGAYNWTYALLQLPSGAILDRLGVRRVGSVAACIWGIAALLSALSPATVVLFASRLLLGVGEAPLFPMNAKAISAWFPPGKRGMPTAMFDAAAKLSPALSIPLVGLLIVRFGWRFGFAVTGAMSLVYAAIFASVYRENVAPAAEPDVDLALPAPAAERVFSLGELLRSRKILGLAIGCAAYNYSFYLLLSWLPGYTRTELHLEGNRSIWAASLPWLFAACIDLFIGGWLVDSLIRKGYDPLRVRRGILLAGMCLGCFVAAPAISQGPLTAMIGLSFGLAGLSAAAPVLWSVPGILVGQKNTGRVGGIVNLGGQIAAIAAPVATAYLYQRTHSFNSSFVLAAGLLVLGVLSYAFLLGRIEPL